MLGLIGGTSFSHAQIPDLHLEIIPTPYGPAEVSVGSFAVIHRHQRGMPPHRINHRAHLAALALLEVDRVVAFGSTGSLKESIAPGSLVIPDDFISMGPVPSIHDNALGHVVASISSHVKGSLAQVMPDALRGGIYVQTSGPRIETPAEVRMLATIADVVGMTIASEASIAAELGIEFGAVCTVDNYANGLGKGTLTFDQILAHARMFSARTSALISDITRALG